MNASDAGMDKILRLVTARVKLNCSLKTCGRQCVPLTLLEFGSHNLKVNTQVEKKWKHNFWKIRYEWCQMLTERTLILFY